MLGSNRKLTLADAMDLQNDDTSMQGRRLLAVLKTLSTSDGGQKPALDLLKAWDARDTADSAAAAVYEVWIAKHLGPAFVKALAPKAAGIIGDDAALGTIIDASERPASWFGGDDPAKLRNAALLDSLGAAFDEVGQRLGPDPRTWSWGKLHKALFEHALLPLADAPTKPQLTVGPLEIGGASNIPHAATYRKSDFRLTAGASFRMVLDVGNWDASRVINAPGQSGDPMSGHYRDLAPLWATGQYVPLLYSRPAVLNAASEVIRLAPR